MIPLEDRGGVKPGDRVMDENCHHGKAIRTTKNTVTVFWDCQETRTYSQMNFIKDEFIYLLEIF